MTLRRFLFVIIFLISFSSCHEKVIQPLAKNGILDLRNWDFKEKGVIRLNGEWNFYWKNFIDPAADFSSKSSGKNIISVPSFWNSFNDGNGKVGGKGYACYHLRILLPPNPPRMAFTAKDIHSAFNLYANGELLISTGTVGADQDSSITSFSPSFIGYSPKSEIVDIVVHVSNFDFLHGGMWVPIHFGETNQLRVREESDIIIDFLILGFILTMGFYHMMRFITVKFEWMSFYFGMICISVGLLTFILDDLHAYRLFPSSSFSLLFRIGLWSFTTALSAFFSFTRSLYKDLINRHVFNLVILVSAFFSLIILISPLRLIAWTLMVYQLITFTAFGYMCFIYIRAVRLKLFGSRILIVGFAILFIASVNDLLYMNHFIETGYIFKWSFILVLILQTYLITRMVLEDYQKMAIHNRDLTETRLGVIIGLAKLAEYRDGETGAHLDRIRDYCFILAEELILLPRFKDYIDAKYVDDLCYSSILHDIGKVGVSDSILLKPGRLTEEEFSQIKKHTTIGGDSIKNVEKGLSDRTFLSLGKEIAYHHHEKWDGSGYPEGKKGTEIPLSARIVALADVYDALTSKRPYKEAFSHEKALKIIIEGRGIHFDPDIVDSFLSREKDFKNLRMRLIDEQEG